MFAIKNLSKIYASQHGTVHALDNISLTIERGSFVTITGGSGSGKTTLLLALGGLNRPSTGTITYDDKNLYSMPESALAEYRNKKVGFVLQTFNLVPYLTAIENIMLPMIFNSDHNGTAQSSAEELLEKVGLKHRTEHLPRELSVGQQQRVAIARALMQDPKVILADEPIASLDPMNAQIVMDTLRRIHDEDGRMVVVNLHTLDTARRYCDRVIGMRDGRIVFDGTPDQLTTGVARDIYGADASFSETATSTSIEALGRAGDDAYAYAEQMLA